MNIDDMFAPSEAALLFGAVLLSALIICMVFQGVEKAHDAITRFWWRRWGSDRMFAHMDAEYESWKAGWLGHAQELADHLRIPQDPNEYQFRALREVVRKRGAEWRREHPDRNDLPGQFGVGLAEEFVNWWNQVPESVKRYETRFWRERAAGIDRTHRDQ